MSSPDNRIVQENRKPGTNEWQLVYTQFDNPELLRGYPMIRHLRSSSIEGYASKTSLLAGESIDLMVSMSPPGKFTVDFYRIGYYGGLGGRHMARIGAFDAKTQLVPMMTMERLRECAWERSVTFTVPDDWTSGVYLAKLSRDAQWGAQSYIVFVVREDRPSDLLCQVSDLTWQAYNKWPANDSLYDDGAGNIWYTGPNVHVSFDRPYAKYCQVLDAPLSAGSGEFLLWEHPMAYWLEREGYDVTYCSNLDLHFHPEILDRTKALVSVAHDEYWSREMFESAITARDNGLSIAFFCGNSIYTEVEFYDSGVTGDPCRAYARKRNFPDTERLMGVKSYGSACGDWVVSKPNHWVYEGTGFAQGDRIPGLIGWEYHGTPTDIPGLEVVASSEMYPRQREETHHSAIVYPCEKGNWVFNAGTIWWSE
ncbi:MAG: hypothetical protein O3A46_16095, partial [Candidatus Poribacteria bacterium]|nr:hypothetical protein [Candidatus Poribacteria bacterium]